MAKKAPNPIDKHVGSRVRMRRMMLGMSQEKLGDALGLTFQQVQKYEKGTNRIGASRLQQISLILQVPVAFFFEGAPIVPGEFEPAPGMHEAPSPAYVSDFLATSDGLSLTKAFMRIPDAKLRRRIVDLVQQIAGDNTAIPTVSARRVGALGLFAGSALSGNRAAAAMLGLVEPANQTAGSEPLNMDCVFTQRIRQQVARFGYLGARPDADPVSRPDFFVLQFLKHGRGVGATGHGAGHAEPCAASPVGCALQKVDAPVHEAEIRMSQHDRSSCI